MFDSKLPAAFILSSSGSFLPAAAILSPADADQEARRRCPSPLHRSALSPSNACNLGMKQFGGLQRGAARGRRA